MTLFETEILKFNAISTLENMQDFGKKIFLKKNEEKWTDLQKNIR